MEKKSVICNTDVMIDYLDHNRDRHKTTKQILEEEIGLESVTLSAITKMELIAGITNKAAIIKLTKHINRFDILSINPEITKLAIQAMENYRLSHGLSIADSLIAATALHTGFEIFTYNVKDFRFISSLHLYKAVV